MDMKPTSKTNKTDSVEIENWRQDNTGQEQLPA